jgi:hypothetical protein
MDEGGSSWALLSWRCLKTYQERRGKWPLAGILGAPAFGLGADLLKAAKGRRDFVLPYCWVYDQGTYNKRQINIHIYLI